MRKLESDIAVSPPPVTVVPAGLERHGLELRYKHQLEASARSPAAARIIRKTFKDDVGANFFQTKGKKTVFCVAVWFSLKRIVAQSEGRFSKQHK